MSVPATWMAVPPEVHSTLLSTGPGPGPLHAAAAAWSVLSSEYTAAANELGAALRDAAAMWQGRTGETYVAAHLPYLWWLQLAGTLAARAATQHDVIAAAYASAVATMPTMPELAANHALHAVLVATNFFGINTIPIAVNEADYVRMWAQAAATMSAYQAVTEAARSLGHISGGAPVAAAAATGGGGGPGGSGSFVLPTPAEIWQMIFGPDGTQVPGQGQPTWSPAEFLQNLSNFFNGNDKAVAWVQQNLQGLLDPSQFPGLISYFVAWQTFRAVNWTLRSLRFLAQLSPLLLPVGLNLAVTNLAGAAGLAGLAGVQPAPPAPVPVLPAAPVETWMIPPAAAAPAAPMPPAAAAPAPAAAVSALPVPAPMPLGGAEGFLYLVGGPGPVAGPRLGSQARCEQAAGETAAVATAAGAATRQPDRGRRQRVAVTGRGYRYEFLPADADAADLAADPGAAPGIAPSARGAGPMGFTGTTGKTGTGAAAGLTTLTADGHGGAPSAPMLPETWGATAQGDAQEGDSW